MSGYPFANIQVQRVAVHEIYKREIGGAMVPPRFSQSLSPLEGPGLDELHQRLIAALGSDSKSIEMEVVDFSDESTFQLCAALPHDDDGAFLERSMKIAQRLADAQTSRKMPGGVVVVLDGTAGAEQNKFSAVIKAEIHGGFLKEITERGPLIRFLNDLLLTPKQKLYKIGAFLELEARDEEEEIRSPEEFSVYIYDSQMNTAEGTRSADYFRETFLGCRIAPSARKLTKDFFYTTKRFLESADLPEDTKLECATALTVYLRSNPSLIQVAEFADDHLPTELKQPYTDFMEEAAFPTQAVAKDVSLIKSKLRIRRLTFSNEIKILGPADRFSKLVQVEDEGENDTLVRIAGKITGTT